MNEQKAKREQKLRAALERFASKPDEALETAAVCAEYLGVCERTLRYHPAAQRVYVTGDRYNFRVGNIRQIARDGFVASAAAGADSASANTKRRKVNRGAA